MANKSIRQIKLQPKSRACQSSYNGLKSVPWLNVSGVWLEQAGFQAGSKVEITVAEKQLIIKAL